MAALSLRKFGCSHIQGILRRVKLDGEGLYDSINHVLRNIIERRCRDAHVYFEIKVRPSSQTLNGHGNTHRWADVSARAHSLQEVFLDARSQGSNKVSSGRSIEDQEARMECLAAACCAVVSVAACCAAASVEAAVSVAVAAALSADFLCLTLVLAMT